MLRNRNTTFITAVILVMGVANGYTNTVSLAAEDLALERSPHVHSALACVLAVRNETYGEQHEATCGSATTVPRSRQELEWLRARQYYIEALPNKILLLLKYTCIFSSDL